MAGKQPNPRLSVVVLVCVFGLASTGAGLNWWSAGEMNFERRGGADAVGRLAGDHVLYRPLCLAWMLTGAAMLLLGGLTVLSPGELFVKLSAFSLLAFLLLVGVTAVVVLNWGS